MPSDYVVFSHWACVGSPSPLSAYSTRSCYNRRASNSCRCMQCGGRVRERAFLLGRIIAETVRLLKGRPYGFVYQW